MQRDGFGAIRADSFRRVEIPASITHPVTSNLPGDVGHSGEESRNRDARRVTAVGALARESPGGVNHLLDKINSRERGRLIPFYHSRRGGGG